MYRFALGILVAFATALLRLYAILPHGKHAKKGARRSPAERCRLGVFLGSGGHTTEALALLSALDFARYCPRTYIVSQGDELSAKKASVLESGRIGGSSSAGNAAYSIITIPRARRVHQSMLTTPFSSMQSLVFCVYQITVLPLIVGRPFVDVLLLNGPGTCVALCIAVYINKFLGFPSPKLVYVESFARVRKLSLSGRILRHLVDRFVVQWPQLAERDSKADFRGWLV